MNWKGSELDSRRWFPGTDLPVRAATKWGRDPPWATEAEVKAECDNALVMAERGAGVSERSHW